VISNLVSAGISRAISTRAVAVVGCVSALTVMAACVTRNGPAGQPLPSLTLEAIAAPVAHDSYSLQLTTAGTRTILSWIDGAAPDTTLKFAERTASGWSEALPVVTGGEIIVSSADVPSVRPLGDGALAAQWLVENSVDPDDPAVYDLRLAWSADQGRTWTPAASPHDDGTRAQHGFASLFDMPGDSRSGLEWLDGRAAAGGLPGDMALRVAQYNARHVQVAQTVIDPRVCECCQTAAAATSEWIVVAYRDRSPDEIRDIYIVRSQGDRWSQPSLVHRDDWKINGCPVNGPAISAQGLDVAVAWFTVQDDAGRAFVAFSQDGGRSFGTPIRLDDAASAGRVQVVLLEDRSSVVTWIESGGEAQSFMARRVAPDGRRGPALTIAEIGRQQYPRLVRHGRELLFAWIKSADGTTHLQTARAPL
jgi:hypothetical protein